MNAAQQPRPIPARFLKPRVITGIYPFLNHRTVAELGAMQPVGSATHGR